MLRTYHLRLVKGRTRGEEDNIVSATIIKALADRCPQCAEMGFASIPFPLDAQHEVMAEESVDVRKIWFDINGGQHDLVGMV